MANIKYDALFAEGKHEVGTINSSYARELVNGAKLTEANADNYTLVELAGFDEEGVRICKPLSDKAKKGFILSTIEEESLFGDGDYVLQGNYNDFYNAVGDMCKLTIQDDFVRFETSAFEKNSDVDSVKKGMVAHYDTTKKKYIVSKPDSAHEDYEASANKYEVVDEDSDFGINVGKTTIRLECK